MPVIFKTIQTFDKTSTFNSDANIAGALIVQGANIKVTLDSLVAKEAADVLSLNTLISTNTDEVNAKKLH